MNVDSVRLGELPPSVVTSVPGRRSIELGLRLQAVECPAFESRRQARAEQSGSAQGPIFYHAAHGSNVLDADGNRYVDLTAGFGSLILGHTPEALHTVLVEQNARLPLALGDVYSSEVKVLATERVAKLFPESGARVLWGMSGSDAVTAAMKTMVLATKRKRILAFEGSYHGLALGPLAACGLSAMFREPFDALVGDYVTFVKYPSATPADSRSLDTDADAVLEHVARLLRTNEFAGVLVEPTQGRGGCVPVREGFLEHLRTLCTETGTLLAVDEVWTGMGRSGVWMQSASVRPDLVCFGKGLGAGYPVSACVGRGEVMAAWAEKGGSALHTATHFGSPLACAAALVALDALSSLGLAERALRVGEAFRHELAAAGFAVSGTGLMVGIEVANALEVSRKLLARGYIVLTGGALGTRLTLSPPLTIAESLLSSFVPVLKQCV
jgi:4-aminobutyrate aminotransferase-like enzyme